MFTKFDILKIIQASPFHMNALRAVHSLDLPNCWIAAGFVRNYIWDVMHDHKDMTPLNDVDVIYFDPDNLNEENEKDAEQALFALAPNYPWSVKNQARMHLKNNEAPYKNIEEALENWCETVTPVGVCLNDENTLSLIAPLGVDDLLNFQCHATSNAKQKPQKLHDYQTRMKEKEWWKLWPKVTVHDLA
ncbi:MAG: nucleotidyltransferase family protein [Alphaproteobacteria bacterium]|nr:nucleotidyltransferase family protein [Alphaproteobacteria bacterium]